ncbi:MAG: hypothetical protein PHC97_01865 [Patescibacteria group bacterium]|nr:hypothetical protein [Patescibacteria group bacterium]
MEIIFDVAVILTVIYLVIGTLFFMVSFLFTIEYTYRLAAGKIIPRTRSWKVIEEFFYCLTHDILWAILWPITWI